MIYVDLSYSLALCRSILFPCSVSTHLFPCSVSIHLFPCSVSTYHISLLCVDLSYSHALCRPILFPCSVSTYPIPLLCVDLSYFLALFRHKSFIREKNNSESPTYLEITKYMKNRKKVYILNIHELNKLQLWIYFIYFYCSKWDIFTFSLIRILDEKIKISLGRIQRRRRTISYHYSKNCNGHFFWCCSGRVLGVGFTRHIKLPFIAKQCFPGP